MRNYLIIAAGLIACSTLTLATSASAATNVDIVVGVPGVVYQEPVYVQPRPVYVRPEYESDWRARQLRAIEWRDNPRNHGEVVSENAHARNDARKGRHGRHHHGDRHEN